MEGLHQLQGKLATQIQQMEPESAGAESTLASIPQHMKALYSVLNHLTIAINDLGKKSVTTDHFDEKMEDLHAKITTNTKEITAMKEETKRLEAKVDSNHNEILTGMNAEIDMRIKKINNVVIFGIDESNKQQAQAKKDDDAAIVNELLSDISPTEVLPTKTMYRAGKPTEGKTRPLIVVLKDKDTKGKLYKNAKNLRGKNKWANVSIRDDKTKLQIHYDRVHDEETNERAKQQNTSMPRPEYNQGYRWVVRGRSGNKRVSKVKFDPDTIFGNNTMDNTFLGFDATIGAPVTN